LRSKKRGLHRRKSIHRRKKSSHKKRKWSNVKKIESICNSDANQTNNHETNNARIPWRDHRNVRIIRIHLRNSDLLHQQQPAVTKSNAKKTSSRSQINEGEIKRACSC
jgi:hypothetical protein